LKKLILSLGILIILSGCFDAQNRNPMVNNSNPSESAVWWRTPYYVDNQDNPWNKYILLSPHADEWSNPWKYDDLRKYGVDVPPKAPALPPKPSKDKRIF